MMQSYERAEHEFPVVEAMAVPRYMPHLNHTEVLAMGMRPRQGNWFDTVDDPASWRAHKLERRKTLASDVYAVCPEGRAGARELATAVYAACDLGMDALSEYPEEEWLWQASLAVHEDLVVMSPTADTYALTAASLCSPSHWRLRDKLGKPMARVHDPIPGIHERLTPRIDRVFNHLVADRPVERFNWSLQTDADRFRWPGHDPAIIAEETPLFYRTERQTLTRLPDSGALAFTIGVHLDPLVALTRHPGALTAMFEVIDAMEPALRDYKGLTRLAPALDKYRTMAGQAE